MQTSASVRSIARSIALASLVACAASSASHPVQPSQPVESAPPASSAAVLRTPRQPRAEVLLIARMPIDDLVRVRSAGEMHAALGRLQPTPPTSSQWGPTPPADLADIERRQVEAFARDTDFATADIALVRAGGVRARLLAATREAAVVTLSFTGLCSPCGGGNPGSFYAARDEYEAAQTGHVLLVRVPRGAAVRFEVTPAACGPCSRNIP